MFIALDRAPSFIGNIPAGSEDLRGTKVIWSKASDTNIYNLIAGDAPINIGLDVQVLIIDSVNEEITVNVNLPLIIGSTGTSTLRLDLEIAGITFQSVQMKIGNNEREFSFFGGNLAPLVSTGLATFELKASAVVGGGNITIDNTLIGTNFVAQYVPLDQAGR